MELTFAFDCQLNDNEDFIKKGTKVSIYHHPLKKEDSTAVMIEKAWSFEGKELTLVPSYEWFLNTSFEELGK